ncbi:HTH-type transcriptional regulator DegA [Dyadobacter sp. CECT 9275]|uniref:HTH-type transcriptional regulator DegA n=1 Tax=Dyadobacter helix TaxID=2822344 RepID=A0A916J8H4_9BACT|nr:LacI family DNA-binding transcriptional regulator [Dyadobacter sp. CECT 9275]CAG4990078.1 HTH-type transcriptional regulator DegA [Dyadobacter sp. CECT 9275]
MEEITLKTIATQLGISISTVSRALKNHPDIKESTKKAVYDLAEQLDYEPNQLAFQLLNKRSNTIGVVVPKISYALYLQAIPGMAEIAEKNGYQLLICQTDDNHEKEVRQIQTLLSSRTSGIVLSPSANSTSVEHLLKVQRKNVPLVLFNRDCEEIICSKVIIDNQKAAYEAVSILLSRGRKRIAYLGGPNHLQISHNRLNGYRKAHADFGIDVDDELVRIISQEKEDMIKAIHDLFESNIQLDAIVAYSDQIAQWALVLSKQKGMKIPEDLSIIGFYDEPVNELLDPPLSSVSQPAYEMGVKALELIFKELNSTRFAFQKIVLESKLIIRGSI